MAETTDVRERRILVAVGEGDESLDALSWCIDNVLNAKFRDTIVLLYVRPPRMVYAPIDGTGYLFSSEIIESMDKYSKEVAETVIQKAKNVCNDLQDVKLQSMVEHGDPKYVICEIAERLNVDVLVMGSHGYGILKRALLGSVSNYCAQTVRCPVLIVKKYKQ